MAQTKSKEQVDIPDGRYFATWSGWTINVSLPEFEDIDIPVNGGVKGINIKTVVEIIDGWLYICEKM